MMLTRFLPLIFAAIGLTSTASAQGNAIFKGGKPAEVKETSYVIRDGVKVETAEEPSEKPKSGGGLFSKFRVDKSKRSAAAPTPTAPPAAYPEADTPVFDVPDAPKPAKPAKPVASTPPPAPAPVIASAEPAPADAAMNEATASGAGLPEPKKERRLTLPKPKLPWKKEKAVPTTAPVDTSNAAVLVNDNGTLRPSGGGETNNFKFTTPNQTNTGPAQAPRKEGDTIVYNSWNDVQSRSTSAADQIVREMRAQEASHKRKMAQAKRDYEAQMRAAQKKAAEEAKIQAMMREAMQGGR